MEAELAPPPAPEPPAPSKPKTVAGVSPSEALDWTGSAFAGSIELQQEDGTTRRTPAEWSPWYGAGESLVFQRELTLPLGIILEEAGGGAIRVAEVREGGSGEQCNIRPGDVLRAGCGYEENNLCNRVLIKKYGAELADEMNDIFEMADGDGSDSSTEYAAVAASLCGHDSITEACPKGFHARFSAPPSFLPFF